MFLDTTSIGCLELQKMLQLLPLLKLDQMLLSHNMNFTNHTGQLLLWNKWFGTHHFDASNNAKCFSGGIDELEQKHKNQWRNHLSIAQAKSFSRVKLIVANIQHFINSTGISVSIVLANIDANLLRNNISSVTKIDSFLRHFLTMKHALLDTETEEGHTVLHQRT